MSNLNFRLITSWLLPLNLLLLVVYDILAARYGGVEATISRTLYEWVKAYPGLAIGIGGLLGHLFFSQGGLK